MTQATDKLAIQETLTLVAHMLDTGDWTGWRISFHALERVYVEGNTSLPEKASARMTSGSES